MTTILEFGALFLPSARTLARRYMEQTRLSGGPATQRQYGADWVGPAHLIDVLRLLVHLHLIHMAWHRTGGLCRATTRNAVGGSLQPEAVGRLLWRQ